MFIRPVIEKSFSALSNNWFQSIKWEFLNHPDYDPKTNKIQQLIQESDGDYNEYETDLYCYCWCRGTEVVYPHYQDYIEFITQGKPAMSAMTITLPIIKFLENTVSSLSELEEKYNMIKATENVIAELGKNIKPSDDTEYNDAFNYIVEELCKSIETKFNHIIGVYQEVFPFKERLKFELNQNELAVLLILLKRSDIFNSSEQADKFLTSFFKTYTLYKNNKGEYSVPTTISTQFSALQDPVGTWEPSFERIRSKILAGFQEFEKLKRRPH